MYSAQLQCSPFSRAEMCPKTMPEMMPESRNSSLLHRARVKNNPHGFGFPAFTINQSRGGWLWCLRAPGAKQGCAVGLAGREQDMHASRTTAIDLSQAEGGLMNKESLKM